MYVCEGGNRLGALTVSLYNRSGPVTTEVTPSGPKYLFMRLAAEHLATKTNGITILSVSVQNEIGPDIAKAIMCGMTDIL